MESGKKLEANDLDIENRQKLQLLEMYERAFDGPEQQLSLTAVTTFNHLADKYKKEEICVIAEILKALATAPIVLHVCLDRRLILFRFIQGDIILVGSVCVCFFE